VKIMHRDEDCWSCLRSSRLARYFVPVLDRRGQQQAVSCCQAVGEDLHGHGFLRMFDLDEGIEKPVKNPVA